MALLEIKNLTKRYGDKWALKNVDLTAERGKIIGLLGPNGSGKTTLLKCVAGLLTTDGGEITVDGEKVGYKTKKKVSFLPERTYVDAQNTVESLFTLFKDFYDDFDEARAYKMLSELGVLPSAKLKSLSKGTKEKVQLIAVTSRDAELFLFDEPIGGVDPVAREYILGAIRSRFGGEATVIISTHLIRDVEDILDEYVFINDGEIFYSGKTADGYGNAGSLDGLFREKFRW